MTKEDLIQYLKEHLTISVDSDGYYDRNSRTVKLYLEGEKITEATFDVQDSENAW